MAGLTCAKEIIDELAGLSGLIECAMSTVALYGGSGHYPEERTVDKVVKAVKELSHETGVLLEEYEDYVGDPDG